MKVAHIFSGDPNSGAAIGTINLCQGLIDKGLNLKLFNDQFNFFIKEKKISFTREKKKFLKSSYYNALDRLFFFGKKKIKFSSGILRNPTLDIDELNNFDLIHLHWINNGFFEINNLLNIKVPIIWTIRDMWPFTGGCHYTIGCEKFMLECENCPNFKSYIPNFDPINKVYTNKKKIFDLVDLNLVPISKWLSNEIKKSNLMNNQAIFQIYNCVDYNLFYQEDMSLARQKLSLPKDKIIILIGSQNIKDKLKNNLKLLKIIKDLDERYQIVSFGKNPFENKKIIHFGFVKEKKIMRELYSSANMFLTFSKQEAFGKTLVESLRCGTPVVSNYNFSSEEIISHKENGYIVRNDNFLDGINWVERNLNKQKKKIEIKIKENFSIQYISQKYFELYEKIIRG